MKYIPFKNAQQLLETAEEMFNEEQSIKQYAKNQCSSHGLTYLEDNESIQITGKIPHDTPNADLVYSAQQMSSGFIMSGLVGMINDLHKKYGVINEPEPF